MDRYAMQLMRRDISPVTRTPKRSMTELAQEFGVSTRSLSQTMRRDASAPKPLPKIKSHLSSGSQSWFEPATVRQWWEARAA